MANVEDSASTVAGESMFTTSNDNYNTGDIPMGAEDASSYGAGTGSTIGSTIAGESLFTTYGESDKDDDTANGNLPVALLVAPRAAYGFGGENDSISMYSIGDGVLGICPPVHQSVSKTRESRTSGGPIKKIDSNETPSLVVVAVEEKRNKFAAFCCSCFCLPTLPRRARLALVAALLLVLIAVCAIAIALLSRENNNTTAQTSSASSSSSSLTDEERDNFLADLNPSVVNTASTTAAPEVVNNPEPTQSNSQAGDDDDDDDDSGDDDDDDGNNDGDDDDDDEALTTNDGNSDEGTTPVAEPVETTKVTTKATVPAPLVSPSQSPTMSPSRVPTRGSVTTTQAPIYSAPKTPDSTSPTASPFTQQELPVTSIPTFELDKKDKVKQPKGFVGDDEDPPKAPKGEKTFDELYLLVGTGDCLDSQGIYYDYMQCTGCDATTSCACSVEACGEACEDTYGKDKDLVGFSYDGWCYCNIDGDRKKDPEVIAPFEEAVFDEITLGGEDEIVGHDNNSKFLCFTTDVPKR